MSKLPNNPTLKMTRERALSLGLLTCKCGHPDNNHFAWGSRPCAHCKCKSLRETAKSGITVAGLRSRRAR